MKKVFNEIVDEDKKDVKKNAVEINIEGRACFIDKDKVVYILSRLEGRDINISISNIELLGLIRKYGLDNLEFVENLDKF